MYKKKLDLHPSELLELRKQGYSNKDIANMLGICDQTVRNYIGRQDGKMDSLKAFEDKPKAEAKAETPVEAIPPYQPKVTREEYILGDDELSATIIATIRYDNERIKLETVGGCLSLTYDQARELVQFLAWASDRCKPKEGETSEAE